VTIKYYLPTPTVNPLFDSFTVDIDVDKRAIISVFRMTTSRYRGSSKGYLLIRKIMTRVRQPLGLRSGSPGIEVLYFLVCPEDGSNYQWSMPVGWYENTTVNDHRGKVYCIRIPSGYVTVGRVYSLPSNISKSWKVCYNLAALVASPTRTYNELYGGTTGYNRL